MFLGNTYRSHVQAAFGPVCEEKKASARRAWVFLNTTPADGGGVLQRAVVLHVGKPPQQILHWIRVKAWPQVLKTEQGKGF